MVRRLLLLLLLIAPFLLELAPLMVKTYFWPVLVGDSTGNNSNVSVVTGLSVFVDNNSIFLKGLVSFIVSIVIILLGLYYLMKLENH